VIAKRNFRNGGRRPAGRRGKSAGLPTISEIKSQIGCVAAFQT